MLALIFQDSVIDIHLLWYYWLYGDNLIFLCLVLVCRMMVRSYDRNHKGHAQALRNLQVTQMVLEWRPYRGRDQTQSPVL